jgi:hypothetical protein
MLRTLVAEGFDIKERELMRVRVKYRWLLRVPNGVRVRNAQGDEVSPPPEEPSNLNEGVEAGGEISDDIRAIEAAMQQPSDQLARQLQQSAMAAQQQNIESPGTKKNDRLERLHAGDAERWASRKRRRRTRGWAGLPADPPGPPRFPSETTLDESKVFLELDAELYRQVRDLFQSICEERGVIKKTLAGPEKWQEVKDALLRTSPHLQQVFWSDANTQDNKALALDVICTDVTKRMRTMGKRMTIAEAKNILNMNPEESRIIRDSFYEILRQHGFSSKIEAGEEQWNELKSGWIQNSELLVTALAPGDADPDHANKVKAVECLGRDVMKRYTDDERKRKRANGEVDAPARQVQVHRKSRNLQNNAPAQNINTNNNNAWSQLDQSATDMQIDPSLLLAAANDPSIAQYQLQENQMATQSFQAQQPYAAQDQNNNVPTHYNPAAMSTMNPQSTSLPVWFRLAPESPVPQHNAVWLATLNTISVLELRDLITAKHPSTRVMKIQGVSKDGMNYEIDEDDELGAYLAHVGGGKASFVVHLVPAYR